MDDYDILLSCYRKSILHPRLQFCLSRRIFNRLLDIELCWYCTTSFHRQLHVCVTKNSPLSRQVSGCTTKPASEIKSDYTFGASAVKVRDKVCGERVMKANERVECDFTHFRSLRETAKKKETINFVMSVCLSVHSSKCTTRLPVDKFSSKLIFRHFPKICRGKWICIKIWQ